MEASLTGRSGPTINNGQVNIQDTTSFVQDFFVKVFLRKTQIKCFRRLKKYFHVSSTDSQQIKKIEKRVKL